MLLITDAMDRFGTHLGSEILPGLISALERTPGFYTVGKKNQHWVES